MTEPAPPSIDPLHAMRRRAETLRESGRRIRREETRLALTRLAIFFAATLMLALAFSGSRLAGWLCGVLIGVFFLLARVHTRRTRARRQAFFGADFFTRRLMRLEQRWIGSGPSGDAFARGEHPYAHDLDLFGGGSLYEYLCTARTAEGCESLAQWLGSPATPETIRARQQAVRELSLRMDFREALGSIPDSRHEARHEARHGSRRAAMSAGELKDWVCAVARPIRLWERMVLGFFSLVTLGIMMLSLGDDALFRFLPPAVLLLALSAARLRGRVAGILRPAEGAARALAGYAEVLSIVEREDFEAPLLRELRARVASREGTAAASHAIRRLESLLGWLEDGRENLAFWPFARVLCLSTQIGARIDDWRLDHAADLPHWMGAVGEIEALAALAQHAWEQPGDVFPEVAAEGPVFDVEGLGHPLLAAGSCVRNDLRLDRDQCLLILSGSNMSGKSTFLRAVGTSAALAQAGSVVRARRLRISPLHIFASIVIRDSLMEGISRFYREIARVREIVRAADAGKPILFLVDEIFQGTNPFDRQAAASAILKHLAGLPAIGMITTHDMTLTAIAHELAPRAANAHFEDSIENGKLCFDYRLRPGVIERGNGLALMRSIGLDV